MNSGDITAVCAVGTLVFSVLCAVIKVIVDGAVSNKLEAFYERLTKDMRKWQSDHIKEEHSGPRRTRR